MPDEAEVFTSRNNLQNQAPGALAEILNLACDLGFDVPDADAVWEEALLGRSAAPEPPFLQALRHNANQQKLILNLEEELERCEIHSHFSIVTHKEEIVKRSEALGKATNTLDMLLQHKDLIGARLQQPLAVDGIPVETEYQSQFAQVVEHVAVDRDTIMGLMEHTRWMENFVNPLAAYKEALKPIPALIAALSRYHEGLISLHSETAKLEASRSLHDDQSISLDAGLASSLDDETMKAGSEPSSPRETLSTFHQTSDERDLVGDDDEQHTPDSHASVSFSTQPQFVNTIGSRCKPDSPSGDSANIVCSPLPPHPKKAHEAAARATKNGGLFANHHGASGSHGPSTPSVASSNSPLFVR